MQLRHHHELPAQQLSVLSSGFSWPSPLLILVVFVGTFALGLVRDHEYIPFIPYTMLALVLLGAIHFAPVAIARLRGY